MILHLKKKEIVGLIFAYLINISTEHLFKSTDEMDNKLIKVLTDEQKFCKKRSWMHRTVHTILKQFTHPKQRQILSSLFRLFRKFLLLNSTNLTATCIEVHEFGLTDFFQFPSTSKLEILDFFVIPQSFILHSGLKTNFRVLQQTNVQILFKRSVQVKSSQVKSRQAVFILTRTVS